MKSPIDISFDFRTDTPEGKDPDAASLTLRRYHKLLWSKPLPGGSVFELSDSKTGCYLYHRSEVGEFILASDSVIPSFQKVPKIRELIPESEIESFNKIGYTIGGMMLWPAKKIDRRMTINGSRGFHPLIKDRFDLSLECIRRHYAGEGSPLSDTFERYSEFFHLFRDFHGFVTFFLLQDLVVEGKVKISVPFDNFKSSPVPRTAEEYRIYRDDAVEFINARNKRIQMATTAA